MKARLMVPTSSVRATLIHSLRTAATPNAVLSSIGHTEQMKMTKIAEMLEILDGVERKRHPGQRRDRLQHLDERIERLADQRRHADQEAERDRDEHREQIAEADAARWNSRAGCRGPCRSARCRRTAASRCSHNLAPTSSGPGIADLPCGRGQPHQLGVFRRHIGDGRRCRARGEMPDAEGRPRARSRF